MVARARQQPQLSAVQQPGAQELPVPWPQHCDVCGMQVMPSQQVLPPPHEIPLQSQWPEVVSQDGK
jgi:hypothetical protein